MAEPLDLDAIERTWLRQCGHCDAGLPMNCVCPTDDYRIPMGELVVEVRRLQAQLTDARKFALLQAGTAQFATKKAWLELLRRIDGAHDA